MKNKIGEIIAQSRIKKGLTQDELASLAKVSIRTIQRIENEDAVPRVSTLKLIDNVLQIDSTSTNKRSFNIIQIFYLLIINFGLLTIYGFLTVDSEANFNSKVGAMVLSIFISLFIVRQTQKMRGFERLMKYGIIVIIYFLFIWLKTSGEVYGSGLLTVSIISSFVLFYGDRLKLFKH